MVRLWKWVGLAIVASAGCESKSNTTVATASATAATASGPEGKYTLDAVSYADEMAKTWAGRFTPDQVAQMKKDLKASGFVQLSPGGKANTNLTTSMGDGPQTPVVMDATWKQEGDTISITPNVPDQGRALTCLLADNALTCTAGGPAMVFVK